MTTLTALGGIGGVVVFLSAVAVIGRAIFRMVNATEANTAATKELTGKVEALFGMYSNHETRISVLEDRVKR